ncbi:MAG: hypothetical protein FP815_04680 [Desulfobulbaceae bacterium]|nr:hypothetical protein [Desulfobulbaceae bacterium]
MQQILTLQAKDGMILAKDVLTSDGRVLCGKGTVLSSSLLARFEKMGIAQVTVDGHPVTIPGEKSLQEELLEVEERFSEVKSIPPLMYLKKRIMKKMVESRSH